MIKKRSMLSTALFALLASSPLIAQGPPDPATHPNVMDVEISGTKTNKLEVKKNLDAKVKEIWKYVGTNWVKVWDLNEGGDYILTNNDTKETRIQNNPVTDDFTQGDKFRIVAEATDEHGNSVKIAEIKEKT